MKINFFKKSIIYSLVVFSVVPVYSQAVSIQSGINQTLLFHGGNIAATYYGEKFVFEYSHGTNLNFAANGGIGLSKDEKEQDLSVFAPYSTGIGLGYLITKNLDIRLEIKENLYRVKSNDSLDELAAYQLAGIRSDLPFTGNGLENWLPPTRNTDPIELTIQKAVIAELSGAQYVAPNSTLRYRTRSVGLALYYRYFPLGGDEGLMLEPSIRYWPNVWDDAPEKVAFENKFGVLGIHKAHDVGLFANVSVGYYKKL